jgi:hypothetical protein
MMAAGCGECHEKSAGRSDEGNQRVPIWEGCRLASGRMDFKLVLPSLFLSRTGLFWFHIRKPHPAKRRRDGAPSWKIFLDADGVGHPPTSRIRPQNPLLELSRTLTSASEKSSQGARPKGAATGPIQTNRIDTAQVVPHNPLVRCFPVLGRCARWFLSGFGSLH